MKRIFILSIILSLILGLNNLVCFASNNDKGTISVNTSASKEVKPDVAEISFEVKTSDQKSLEKASILNKGISDKVYSTLEKLIDSEKGDYIKTAGYSANPIYSYVNSKKIFDRYEVSNTVIVHTKSLDTLGKMIDIAIKEGATTISNLSFTLAENESICNLLISDATQKAKSRAQSIADALSVGINGIDNINASCNLNNYNTPRLYLAKNMLSDVAMGTETENYTSISSGTIKVNANVNASFYVK